MKKSLLAKIASVGLGLSMVCGGKLSAAPSKQGIIPTLACNWIIPGGAAFATGKTARGVVELLTLNYLGFGYIVDTINLLGKNYTDSEGNTLEKWF